MPMPIPSFISTAFASCLSLLLFVASLQAADWPTYRGNAERTGNLDGQRGPAKPRVLWMRTSKDNYIGSPSVADQAIVIAALGAFNSGSVLAFDANATEAKVAWSKTPPLLKLPTVSSPIFAGGTVVFGDGMHQTDGAIMRGIDSASGRLLWQHAVPGKLVHMEGAVVIAEEKIYLGAGHAGVICLDPTKLTLGGKEQTPEQIKSLLAAEWKNLEAKYEEEKRADPDFAVPPSEDSLPKAHPRLQWQVGSNQWHVDAPLTLAGKRLLVASAYLDHEKEGKRGLFCLDSATGDTLWESSLEFNPWAGATITGNTAILGCSNIRLDPKEIKRGRGQVLAINLEDGKPRWKKIVPGGVVSAIAVKDGLAIACATDGKIRAYDVSAGNVRWTYDAGAPLFAGAAIAGDTIYAGDLAGVIHAIGLDGKGIWKFNLNGMGSLKQAQIYGAPVIHGGRIFVGTCNLDASAAGEQAIVCIGE